MHYLTRDILPVVWATDPTLTCKIVGHGWHADRLAGLDPRVEVVGEVEDLADVFDAVRLTVAPLRFGAGIKGKVLDSFSAGLPCVMTPITAEGLPLSRLLSEFVGADPVALAEMILRLHGDLDVNAQTGDDAARTVAREFCQERVTTTLSEVLFDCPSATLKKEARLFVSRSSESRLSVA